MRGSDLGRAVGMAPPGVEHASLALGAQQRLVFVLAMDVGEAFAEVPQVLLGHRGTVDECARTPGPHQHPAHQALGVVQVVGREPRAHRGLAVHAELGGHLGALAAGADLARLGAVAEHQPEGVDQHRLAGPGLAGQHGEAGAELEFHPFDQGEVADLQEGQHRGWITAVCASGVSRAGSRSSGSRSGGSGARCVRGDGSRRGRPAAARS